MAASPKSSEQVLAERLRGERDHYARQLQEATSVVDNFQQQLDSLQSENLALRQLLMDKEDSYQREIATFHTQLGTIRTQMRQQVEKFKVQEKLHVSDAVAFHERVLNDVYMQNEELEAKMKFLMRTAALQAPYPPSPVKTLQQLDCRQHNPEDQNGSPDGTPRYEQLAKLTNGRKKLQTDFKISTVEANVALEKEVKMLRSALAESKRANNKLADSLRELVAEVERLSGAPIDQRNAALLAAVDAARAKTPPQPRLLGTSADERRHHAATIEPAGNGVEESSSESSD